MRAIYVVYDIALLLFQLSSRTLDGKKDTDVPDGKQLVYMVLITLLFDIRLSV